MENKPSLNFSVTVHQARIDSSITSLSLSSQIQIAFNGTSVRTKTKSEIIPMWEEVFNFEYIEGCIEITLLHNPPILKEIIIGKCLITAGNASGWFDLKGFYGKIGSVRLSLKIDPLSSYPEEFQLKLIKLQIVYDEISLTKQKYLARIEKLKKKKSRKCGELKDSSNNYQRVVRQEDDIDKIADLLKIQEQNLATERENIENSWKEIEKQKKELESLQLKVKMGSEDLKILKNSALPSNLSSRNYLKTPQKSAKTPHSSKSSSRLSNLSYTQPRTHLDSDSVVLTPKSKLIQFE